MSAGRGPAGVAVRTRDDVVVGRRRRRTSRTLNTVARLCASFNKLSFVLFSKIVVRTCKTVSTTFGVSRAVGGLKIKVKKKRKNKGKKNTDERLILVRKNCNFDD